MNTSKKLKFPSDRPTPPEDGVERRWSRLRHQVIRTFTSTWLWSCVVAIATIGIFVYNIHSDYRDQREAEEQDLQRANHLIRQALIMMQNDPEKVEVGRDCIPPKGEARLRVEEARMNIDRAAVLVPNYIRHKTAIGIYYQTLCEMEAAESHCREAIKQDERFAPGHLCLGSLRYQEGRYDDAIKHFRKAAEADSGDRYAWLDFDRIRSHAWFNIGEIYMKRQEYPQALEYFERASDLKGADSAIWRRLGQAYYYNKNWTEALFALREAVRLNEEDLEALYYLALVCQEAGNHSEATKLLRKALETHPPQSSPPAKIYYSLVKSLFELGQRQSAQHVIKMCLQEWPDHSDCRALAQ